MYVEVDDCPVDGSGGTCRREKQAGRWIYGSAKIRDLKLASVLTQTTPDEETGQALFDLPQQPYVGTLEKAEDFGARIRRETLRRGSGSAAKNRLSWEMTRRRSGKYAESIFLNPISIPDIYYALERLHALCQGLYPGKASRAARREAKLKEMLLNDKFGDVIVAARHRLKDLGTQRYHFLEDKLAILTATTDACFIKPIGSRVFAALARRRPVAVASSVGIFGHPGLFVLLLQKGKRKI